MNLPFQPMMNPPYGVRLNDTRRVAVQAAIDMMRNNAAIADQTSPFSGDPELLLQAVIVPGERTAEGQLVEAVALPWFDIVELLVKDPRAMYELDWRKFEEIIAGAYTRAGYQVTLTSRSGDGGKDVIATRHDLGGGYVKFFDQVKRYTPPHVVTLEEVDAMIGVLNRDTNVSKGIVTTTSTFAPELQQAKGIKELIPYRLELRDRFKLLPWLESLAQTQ